MRYFENNEDKLKRVKFIEKIISEIQKEVQGNIEDHFDIISGVIAVSFSSIIQYIIKNESKKNANKYLHLLKDTLIEDILIYVDILSKIIGNSEEEFYEHISKEKDKTPQFADEFDEIYSMYKKKFKK